MKMKRFNQLLESTMGNVKPLISESDDKTQTFLNKYIGKTFTLYADENLQDIWGSPNTIEKIYYGSSGLVIEFNDYLLDQRLEFDCLYNPSRFSNKAFYGYKDYLGGVDMKEVYNKSLTNDIFTKGSQLGIKFCQKPKSDFGSVNPPPTNMQG